MSQTVYVYDPTVTDKLSQVRGIGRYLQILHENFDKEFIFISDIKNFKFQIKNSVFINPFFNFLQPPLTIRRIAQRQVAIIHDLIPLKYPKHFPVGLKGKLNIFLNKLAIKNYDVIITDSEASKKDIVEMLGIAQNKVKVVYPCLPKIFVSKVHGSQFMVHGKETMNDERLTNNYCIYVGDATWNKNLVNLAKAIKTINVTCIFVGKVFSKVHGSQFMVHGKETINDERLTTNHSHPWQLELQEFYNEIKDDKRFIFPGFVSDSSLLKLYQQANVNILPSRDEGFGFSWLESASQQCPSVVGDIPIFHEISVDSAVFCNTNTPDDLAKAIGKLYFNNDSRNLWGQKAYERSKYFSSEKFKKDFSRALE